MPEGPELRCSADYLRPLLLGKKIVSVFTHSTGRYSGVPPVGQAEFLAAIAAHGPPVIEDVNVRGKFMYWTCRFNDHDDVWSLWTTYGMSGQWMSSPERHAAYCVRFCDVNGKEDEMHFVDPRHFGTLKWVSGRAKLEKKLSTLGPDIIANPPTGAVLSARAARWSDREVCRVLMDQGVVAGIGNYIKSEALYRAFVAPRRLVQHVTADEWSRIAIAAHDVACESYADQGSTISTYRNPDGTTGGGQFSFRVYGRTVDPDGRRIISEETSDGRTSWWVPGLQV